MIADACIETIDIEFSHGLGYRYCVRHRLGWWEHEGAKIPRSVAYPRLRRLWEQIPSGPVAGPPGGNQGAGPGVSLAPPASPATEAL